jgi:hypothetical protein
MKESYSEGRKIEVVAYYRKCKSVTRTAAKFKVHRNSITRWNKELPAMLPDGKWAVKKDIITGKEEYVLNTSKEIEDKSIALNVDMIKIMEISVQMMLSYLIDVKKISVETNKKITATDYARIMKIMNTVLPYTVPSASSKGKKAEEESQPKTSALNSFKELYTDLAKNQKKLKINNPTC